MSLLLDIARCPNVQLCLANPDITHPCAPIVASQKTTYLDFQLPEPWSGHIEEAPILFLGSNPNISHSEEYPRSSWSDDDVRDFFVNRFHAGRQEWVRDGLHILLKDGSHSEGWVRYWAAVNRRSAELLERPDPRPGIDYSISEVVHCKSRYQEGVRAAADECAERYLGGLIAESGASIIVCLGRFAGDTVRRVFNIPEDQNVSDLKETGSTQRIFTFLPHPNARSARTFADRLTPEELERLLEVMRKREPQLATAPQ